MTSVAYLTALIEYLINNLTHTALLVDDSVMARRHMRQLLQHCYIHCLEAENGEQGLEILKQHPRIMLVIVDHDMLYEAKRRGRNQLIYKPIHLVT